MRDVIVGEKAIRKAWTEAEAAGAKAARAAVRGTRAVKAGRRQTPVRLVQTDMPLLMPAQLEGTANAADGVVLRFELNPFQIVELPVEEVRKRPKLKESDSMWTQELLEIFRLTAALRSQDATELRSVVEAIHERQSVRLPGGKHAATVEELLRPENLATYLGAAITTYQQANKLSTTLVIWRDRQGKLQPGLLCPNERAAAFALAVRGYSLKPASCPVCGNRFAVDEHHVQTYCSPRCRSRKNVRASRHLPIADRSAIA